MSIFIGETQENIQITVGYHNQTINNQLCQFYIGPLTSAETRRFDCSDPIFGRFVFIQRTSNSTRKFSFCEVKVFGAGECIIINAYHMSDNILTNQNDFTLC